MCPVMAGTHWEDELCKNSKSAECGDVTTNSESHICCPGAYFQVVGLVLACTNKIIVAAGIVHEIIAKPRRPNSLGHITSHLAERSWPKTLAESLAPRFPLLGGLSPRLSMVLGRPCCPRGRPAASAPMVPTVVLMTDPPTHICVHTCGTQD